MPADLLGGDFGGQVSTALRHAGGFIAQTHAAGLVAVACPYSVSDLEVYSVIAADDVPAAQVHAAAAEVASMVTAERTTDTERGPSAARTARGLREVRPLPARP